jgi:GH35 family endo-1,4-beta-xylanase
MLIKHSYLQLFLISILVWSPCYGDWKSDANARIEQIRKRNAEITVVDVNGQPVPGINVQISQIKHRFAFGTCIAYGALTGSSQANYRNFILDHYEWAVCENEMKWSSNESTRDVWNYTQADYIANWCADNGLILRGHTLVWETGGQTPSWVSGLACSTYPPTSEMMDEIDERINSTVGRYAGQIVQWDVDNEMLSGNMFDCLGEAGRAHFFQQANSIDPDCKFMMNEYSGNSFGGYDGVPYRNRAQGLINLGAPIEAIGIQAHVASPFQPENYYNNVLNVLDDLGLPIMATEFDVEQADVTQRATDLENFYRICFSHPNVQGIIQWGFWDGSQWRANAQLVETNWTINAAGQRYIDLLDEWTTEDSNTTDSDGYVGFRGFHGTYEITLSAPGQTAEVYTIELEPGDTPALFEIETDLEEPLPDFTPPDPDPMTWASVPAATGPSSITMTAATASDDTPPVRYYFECTNYGDANSSWQTSPTYVAQGLSPSTQYTFRVKARDSAVVPNETGWSETASATTQPPSTDVEILGSWVTGTTHAKESGTNRALIFIAHAEHTSGTVTLDSVTYGGQPMTKIIDEAIGTGYSANVAAFILDEAGIEAATNGTFNPTWSTTPGAAGYTSVFIQNVDQTTLVGDTDSAGTTSSNPIVTDALSTIEGDMVFVAATCGNLNTYTLNNGFTEGTDQTFGDATTGGTGVAGYKAATGVAETPSATFGVSINRQVIIGFVVQARGVPTYLNCGEVQAAGLRLESDLNGNCYVDYEDLETIAYYWLDTECGDYNNCEGADFEPRDGIVDLFDYSDFAVQWLLCNDPQDVNCIANW